MYETMQSSHRLCPAMALVRALLTAPTASGDGDVERFCAPLPPAPHFSGACPEKARKFVHFYTFLGGALNLGPQVEGTRKSRWSWVGTSKIIS
jgi:hypothetical protein